MFKSFVLEQLTRKAANSGKHIVLPEGTDARTLAAAARIQDQGLMRLTLLGDPGVIAEKGKALGLNPGIGRDHRTEALGQVEPLRRALP